MSDAFYTQEMLDSIKKVEASRASRIGFEPRRMTAEEKEALLESVKVDSVLKGTVESLQTYGAFVRLENGLSGLVHISQISDKRIKSASDVLSVGQEIDVKVIGIKDGKISLSMKALLEPEEEIIEEVEIPEAENIGTSLGDLFKNIKL